MSGSAPVGPADLLVDGQPPQDGLSFFDRGLHFGDGLFETIACRQRKPRFLTLHMERLALGCEKLRIAPLDVERLRGEIRSMALVAEDSLIKVIVTRGVAVARGYGVSGREIATRLVFRYPWPGEDPAAARDGVTARTARLRLGENPALGGMKHLNRLEQVLARSEAPVEDAAELVVFSSSGNLVSGSMSNLFLVQNGRLRTPRVDVCGVAGVMRRVVLREAERAGVVAEECVLARADLDSASEVFLTNARIGIWPVRQLDSRVLAVGEITRRLQATLAPLLANPVDA